MNILKFGLMLSFLGASGSIVRLLSREDKTALVRQVEAAGAGDLDHVDTPEILEWFKAHPGVADRIAPQCQQIIWKHPARWNKSLEGRICLAAQPIATLDRLYGPGHFTASN